MYIINVKPCSVFINIVYNSQYQADTILIEIDRFPFLGKYSKIGEKCNQYAMKGLRQELLFVKLRFQKQPVPQFMRDCALKSVR
ncbi:MAG: hypothetical protein CVU00_13355 [Bacteroidetes bacterium HGW-Bacteroidetes-17]|nr:MAG: hypothetical protein CVU00_13355 [Bacteroidetes bacterium HGW-Bacteroidetes-17]